MIEIVKAQKLHDICKDIQETLAGYIKDDPNQLVEVEVHDVFGTNTIIVDICGRGHRMNRPINYKEFWEVQQ